MDLFIVGAGGLLGGALASTAAAAPSCRVFALGRIPWSSPTESRAALLREFERFLEWRRSGVAWSVLWAAGGGVIASSNAQLQQEESVLMEFAGMVARRSPGAGSFLFASSASVYGDSGTGSCDERSGTRPLNGYAVAKLRQEEQLGRVLAGRLPLVVARIATLYGPGQNLEKRQGLISTMCREAIVRRTISVFVPWDTTRDYLYTSDAARQCLHLANRAAREQTDLLRVVASHRATTVAEIARTVQSVARRRVPVLQCATAEASAHGRRLALTTFDPELRAFPVTALPSGVHRVYQSVFERQIAPGLVR